MHQNGPGIVCEASLEDLPALLALEKQGFPRDAFSEEQFRHLLTEAHPTTLAIAYDGAVRGADYSEDEMTSYHRLRFTGPTWRQHPAACGQQPGIALPARGHASPSRPL